MMGDNYKTIIVVDKDIPNLVETNLMLKPYHLVFPASSLAKMYIILEEIIPDLIILDKSSAREYAADVMTKACSENHKYSIPVLITILGKDEVRDCPNLQFMHYIIKPFTSQNLLTCISNVLKQ